MAIAPLPPSLNSLMKKPLTPDVDKNKVAFEAKSTHNDRIDQPIAIKTNDNKVEIVKPIPVLQSSVTEQNGQRDRLAIELRNANLPPTGDSTQTSKNGFGDVLSGLQKLLKEDEGNGKPMPTQEATETNHQNNHNSVQDEYAQNTSAHKAYTPTNLPPKIGEFTHLRGNIYQAEDRTYGKYVDGELHFRGFNI